MADPTVHGDVGDVQRGGEDFFEEEFMDIILFENLVVDIIEIILLECLVVDFIEIILLECLVADFVEINRVVLKS